MICGMALGFKAVCIYRDYQRQYGDAEGLVWLCFDGTRQYFFSHVVIKPQLLVMS